MKVTGREFMDWHDNHWPSGYIWDGTDLETHNEDGSWMLDPDRTYDLSDLIESIYREEDVGDVLDPAKLIRAYRKKRTHVDVVTSVPRAREAEFKELVKSFLAV